MSATAAPFRPSPSGLLIPSSVEREREVWTRDEWKTVDRAAKLLKTRGVRLTLVCEQCEVDGTLTASTADTGEIGLSCAHKTRILARH